MRLSVWFGAYDRKQRTSLYATRAAPRTARARPRGRRHRARPATGLGTAKPLTSNALQNKNFQLKLIVPDL